MTLKNNNLKAPDAFEELKKLHISKLTLDVNKNTITLEKLENQQGKTRIFSIESNPSRKDQCIFKHSLKNKKDDDYIDIEKPIFDVSFKDILRSLNLAPLLGYFIVSEIINE